MKTINTFDDAINYVARVIVTQTVPPTPIGHRQIEMVKVADKLLKAAGGKYPFKVQTSKGELGHISEVKVKGKTQKTWQHLATWQIFN